MWLWGLPPTSGSLIRQHNKAPPPRAERDFVTVSRAANPAEADLVRSRLEANGFLVNLKDERALSVWLRPARRRRPGPGSGRPGRKRPRLAGISRPSQCVKPSQSLRQLKRLLPRGELWLDPAVLENVRRRQMVRPPSARGRRLAPQHRVRRALLKFASAHRIPVTARGAGFGYVGGCVPATGRDCSFARTHESHQGNPCRRFVAVAEAGVILQTLQDAVERQGIVLSARPRQPRRLQRRRHRGHQRRRPALPQIRRDAGLRPGPASRAGRRRRGRAGRRTHKNKTGFDLTRIAGRFGRPAGRGHGSHFEAHSRCRPFRALLVVGFDSMKAAARAIRAIFANGFLPSALEVADEFTLEAAAPPHGQPPAGRFARLADGGIGRPENRCEATRRPWADCCAARRPVFVQRAYGPRSARSCGDCAASFPIPARHRPVKLNQDIVVPRGRLEDLFRDSPPGCRRIRPAHRLFRPRRRRQYSRQRHV
jgi:glycolate oxidase